MQNLMSWETGTETLEYSCGRESTKPQEKLKHVHQDSFCHCLVYNPINLICEDAVLLWHVFINRLHVFFSPP